jgi:multidrug efflux pump subunit AcrA (membrane-fusion protein)
MRADETRSWLAGAVVTGLALGCASSEGSTVEDEPAGRVINVEVMAVEQADFTDYVRVTGEVQALHDVVVASEEGGAVTRFLVARGAPGDRGAG